MQRQRLKAKRLSSYRPIGNISSKTFSVASLFRQVSGSELLGGLLARQPNDACSLQEGNFASLPNHGAVRCRAVAYKQHRLRACARKDFLELPSLGAGRESVVRRVP